MKRLVIFTTLSLVLGSITSFQVSGNQANNNNMRQYQTTTMPEVIMNEPQVREVRTQHLSNRRISSNEEEGEEDSSRTMAKANTRPDYDNNNEPQKKHEAQKLIRDAANLTDTAAATNELTLNRQRRSSKTATLDASADESAPPNTIQALIGQPLIVPCSNLTGLLQTDQLSRSTPANQVAPLGSSAVANNSVRRQQTSSGTFSLRSRQLTAAEKANKTGGIVVSLIVWHKDDPQLSSPIFTIDARASGGALREARQQTGAGWLRGRAHFEESSSMLLSQVSMSGQTPALVIDEARQSDAGLYTCTVEFHKAPTQIYQIRVNLIDPPRDMVIREAESPITSGASLTGAIGPYDEDSRLGLICEVEPGKPTSQVSWWQLSSITSMPPATIWNKSTSSSNRIVGQQMYTSNSLANVDYLTTISVTVSARDLPLLDLHHQMGEENLFVAMHSRPFQHSADDSLDDLTIPLIRHSGEGYKLKHWSRIKDVSLSIGDKIQATLQLGPLSRAYQGQEFLCLASNTNNNYQLVVAPLNNSVLLGMNLKPNEVKIMDKSKYSFKLGEKIMIECQVHGSRPRAQIRWFKDKQQLEPNRHHHHHHHDSSITEPNTDIASNNGDNNGYLISDINTSQANNFTQISYLTLVPQLSDNMKSFSCVANNPSMTNLEPLSDTIIMNVQYPPQLRLQLGSGLRSEMIKVGSDVFMECNIESNPPIDDLSWYFNDQPVYANVSAGLIISNRSLVLQRIRAEHRGKYQCAAQNIIGRSISDKLELRPKFEPICDYSLTKTRYEVAIDQQIRVACNVIAEPNDDIHFIWKFNSSSQITSSLDVGSQDSPLDQSSANNNEGSTGYSLEDHKQYETNFTSSYATFSPKSRRQYGQLLCYASNSMGRQSKPCTIWLVQPELPEPVFSCFFDGITNSSLGVYCQAPPENDNNPASGGKPSYLLELVTVSSTDLEETNNQSSATSTSSHLKHHQRQEQNTTPASSRTAAEITTTTTTTDSRGDETTNFDEQSDGTELPGSGKRQDAEIRRARSDSPSFQVTDLSPATHYMATIYVQNSKGRSRPVFYPVSTAPTISSSDDSNNHQGSSSLSGRVQFINKRLSSSSSVAGGGEQSTSLADRLISYLRVDDYLSRSVNSYNTANGSSRDQQKSHHQSLARPLLVIVVIVLLVSSAIIVAVAFFVTRLCRSKGHSRSRSCRSVTKTTEGTKTTTTTKKKKKNQGRSRIWSTNNSLERSLGTKLSTYGGIREPQLERGQLRLTPACSSSGDRLKALAGGSGSDTSRETNTDSTLICSAKSNNNSNCQMIESQATAPAIVSTLSDRMVATPAGRASRESLYGAGGVAESPIMMMMRPSQSVMLATEQQQQLRGLYSTINRQQQQQQQQHLNCSPLLAHHSETPQMSIQSDCTSQTTTTTATQNADLLMQVNHSDNHQELQTATAAASMSEHGGSNSCSAAAGLTEPLYVIRSSASSGSSNFVPPTSSSCNRMAANQNCSNSSLPEQQQQSIRLVGHKGAAATATIVVSSESLAQQQQNFGFAGWAHLGDPAAADNRSGNGARHRDETQVNPTTADLVYGNGNASACNHHSMGGAGVESSSMMMAPEPPIPAGFLPSSSSIPVSLSECQHLHLPRRRRYSQEFQPFNNNNNAGSYLTLEPAALLDSGSQNNYRQQDEYQPAISGHHQFDYAPADHQQQPVFLNDLSQPFITYVAAEPEYHLCDGGGGGGGGRASVRLGYDHDHHHQHQHQCAASQTLDNSFRRSWRVGPETPLGLRRGSFDRGPARQHTRQGQRVKFDDQQNGDDRNSLRLDEPV